MNTQSTTIKKFFVSNRFIKRVPGKLGNHSDILRYSYNSTDCMRFLNLDYPVISNRMKFGLLITFLTIHLVVAKPFYSDDTERSSLDWESIVKRLYEPQHCVEGGGLCYRHEACCSDRCADGKCKPVTEYVGDHNNVEPW